MQSPVVENLAITHIVTIHNNPERAATPKGMKPSNHLRIELADTETEPIRQYFEKANGFIRKVRPWQRGWQACWAKGRNHHP